MSSSGTPVGDSARRAPRQSLVMKLMDDAERLAQGAFACVHAAFDQLRQGSGGDDILIIVFSRDRALQLELLLETYGSLVSDAPRLTILYSVTSEAHRAAYHDVLLRYGNLVMQATEENDFRADLLNALKRSRARNLMFLVDDLMFIRPLDGQVLRQWRGSDGILSLRLGENIRSSYNSGVDALPRPPELRQVAKNGAAMVTWVWKSGVHDWQLALSLDGNLLPKALVERLIAFSRFRAPNSLEGALGRFRFLFRGKRGFAFRTSRMVNLPLNTVKSEDYYFPHAGASVDAMLADRDSGMKFDASAFPHDEHGSCHFPWLPPLVPRSKATRVDCRTPGE